MSTPDTPDAASDAATASTTSAPDAGTSILPDLAPPAPAAIGDAPVPPPFPGLGLGAPDATSGPEAAATLTATGASGGPVPAASTPLSGPRVRWAGIVWGLVLAGIAAFALWILTSASRQAAVTEWLLHLTPTAAIAYAVLVIGASALVAGIVGLARRAQRGVERRRAASTS